MDEEIVPLWGERLHLTQNHTVQGEMERIKYKRISIYYSVIHLSSFSFLSFFANILHITRIMQLNIYIFFFSFTFYFLSSCNFQDLLFLDSLHNFSWIFHFFSLRFFCKIIHKYIQTVGTPMLKILLSIKQFNHSFRLAYTNFPPTCKLKQKSSFEQQ
jgi:hypothetical protein